MSKISVIGAGSVGATIANDLMIQGTASEIVLVDINKQKAFGEALDIYQGAPFCSPAIVRSGDYSATANSDIVVITSGLPRKAGQSRLDLAQANVNIIKDIAPQVVKEAPNAKYVIVSNPVDVLTYVFHKVSGLPENQIIGSGTILDTSRLQSELAKIFRISPKNVHAHVYGEHGDSSFVPWSLVHIANNHVDAYKESSPDRDRIDWHQQYAEVEEFVRTSGGQVIKAKGATFYAVAMSVCHRRHGRHGLHADARRIRRGRCVPVHAGAGRQHRRARQDPQQAHRRRGRQAPEQREQAEGSHLADQHLIRIPSSPRRRVPARAQDVLPYRPSHRAAKRRM